jgi:cholesterol oxidase
VLVLERGKRYTLGSFPRTPHAMANNFWNPAFEKRSRPKAVAAIQQRGLFDVRNYKNIDVVLGAGLGGGSLIYANENYSARNIQFIYYFFPKCGLLQGRFDPVA